jgi:hypothetical protein
MEETMIQAVRSTPESEPATKLVTITFDAQGQPVFDPLVVRIEPGFRGVIRWQIDHPDAAFNDPPVVFFNGPATVPPPDDLKNCHVWWNNDNESSYHIPYSYRPNLQHRLEKLNPDPTVENDPPRQP